MEDDLLRNPPQGLKPPIIHGVMVLDRATEAARYLKAWALPATVNRHWQPHFVPGRAANPSLF